MKTFKDLFSNLITDALVHVKQWSLLKKFAATLGILAAVAFVIFFDVPDLSALRAWSDATGAWFPVLFWLAYVVITQFPIPRTVLTLSSGILFGPLQGIFIALSASTVAAAVSLLLVRSIVGGWITPHLKHPTVASINDHLRRRGWVAVLSLRMIAGVPFSILNYVAALTSIRLIPFAFATMVGSAPGTVMTVFFGDTLTGTANPAIIAAVVVLALLGVIGLILDNRSRVKSGR